MLSRRGWIRRRLEAFESLQRQNALPRVVDVETIVGPLWMHADDRLMTPVVVQHGFWEPELGNLLRRTVTPGMTFVDVGANVGYFSVMAAGLVGPAGTVCAVEPEPGNLSVLGANLWRNGHRNATIVPTAAYSFTGEIAFVVPEISRAVGHVTKDDAEGTRIGCVSLDDLLDGQAIHYLKIDAEGADLEVLRGGREVLAASPDVTVIVEVLTEYAPERQFREFMDEGFAVHLIDPDGGLARAGMDEILTAAAAVTYMNVALKRE
jgi:FkbM family methyltransferase